MRCICGGSKAIISKLITADTLLCGGGGAGREGRGVAFLNFLRDVNDILYPTTTTATPTSSTTAAASAEELQQVWHFAHISLTLFFTLYVSL